jgi:hypothetical protein
MIYETFSLNKFRNLSEIDWGGMNGLNLAQDRNQWWAVVNTVLNPLGFRKMLGNSGVAERLVASQEGLVSME